jgi:NAD(P)-dependent dehydrogenase (short-subunit alcohol dehydrogenase family)
VVITGASSGIGLEAVRQFAREGADLGLIARGREALEDAARMACAEGATALVLPADVAKRRSLTAAIDRAARELGGIDVLVVGAAGAAYGPFAEVPPEDFDRTMAVTFTGAVDTIRAGLPHLRRSGGTIVAVGSIVARVPAPLFSPYVAAKGALRAFLGSLRSELAREGSEVKVCIVHPGPVDTPFWESVTSATGMLPPVPPGSYRPEPVARAIVECAIRPRAEVTVGGGARMMELAYGLARPVTERALAVAVELVGGLETPAKGPGALWEPHDDARTRGNSRGRPSLLTPLILRLSSARLRS